MKCPNCGLAELVDLGNVEECPKCRYARYFAFEMKSISTEPEDAWF